MTRPNARPLSVMLGDQAVEATYILARDIRSSAAMRQQPLFEEVDEPALEAARRGIVSIVLRIAFVLHAESLGILPLGHARYDRRFALTPIGASSCFDGAWRRLIRLSELLSGERRVPLEVPIRPWGSALFGAPSVAAFMPPVSGTRQETARVLAPSDRAIYEVVRALGWAEGQRVDLGSVAVDGIAGLYERLIGFEIVRCTGRSIRMGRARTVVDLDALLAMQPAQRADGLAAWGLKPSARVMARIEAAGTIETLCCAIRARRAGDPLAPGTIVLQPNLARRRAGAHYTPPAVAQQVVAATLAPLIEATEGIPDRILALRVCDPAMGTGGFLVEACRQLAEALAAAWGAHGCAEAQGSQQVVAQRARHRVASSCLYGVDLDPLAVDLARLCLQFIARGPDGELPQVACSLRCGDALVGMGAWDGANGARTDPNLLGLAWIPGGRAALRAALKSRQSGSTRPLPSVDRVRGLADRYVQGFLDAHEGTPSKRALERFRQGLLMVGEETRRARTAPMAKPFHWPLEFPEVFTYRPPGFDAFLGNPPWVAFAGRAAQPLEKGVRGYFLHVSEAFRGYRTLQGLFVHRCASLLRPGGRMGLVVPTSMSDLDGYVPVRLAHDALCEPDVELPDFGGDAFEGVFQPSMALLSTRRPEPRSCEPPAVWQVRRDDLEDWARELLERMATIPPMPACAFAERGFQSTRQDRARMRVQSGPAVPFVLALREGADVRAFEALAPRLFFDPSEARGHLHTAEQFGQVDVLIRQTARYPIAALADGVAFRNSILAGFAFDGWPATALVAYLNAWPVRWLHYMRYRDARQGMPQIKISHLRSLPMPPLSAPDIASLDALGASFAHRNTGISTPEQLELDALVTSILGMCSNDLARIQKWRRDKGFA